MSCDRAVRADDGVARADHDRRIGIGRPQARLQLAREAVVQALELGLAAPRTDRGRKTAASRRSRASRTSGFSILLNQPMNRVSAARGMRLVSRKLRSSCCVRAEIRPRTVMNLSDGLASAGWHGFAPSDSVSVRRCDCRRRGCLPQIAGAPGAVAGQAPLADRPFQDVAAGRAADPVLRIRRSSEFFRSDGAPADGRHPAPGRLLPARRPLPGALRQEPADDAEAADAHLRPAIHRSLPGAVPVQPAGARASRHRRLHAVVGRGHRHRSRRQRVLRPDRLLRRQYLRQRLLQGVHRQRRDARPCARPGARPLPSRHRRQRRRGCARFPGSTKSRSTCPAPKR